MSLVVRLEEAGAVGQLRLPEGAEAGFRLVDADEFGPVFTMHLYGAGRRGWFLLHSRLAGAGHDPGPRPLGKGQWRTFLGLVKACRFWDLPERRPAPPEIASGRVMMKGGGWLDLAGRDGTRYHRVYREGELEPGLASVLRFCQRQSGLFVPPAAPPRAEPPPMAPKAEPGAPADGGGMSALPGS